MEDLVEESLEDFLEDSLVEEEDDAILGLVGLPLSQAERRLADDSDLFTPMLHRPRTGVRSSDADVEKHEDRVFNFALDLQHKVGSGIQALGKCIDQDEGIHRQYSSTVNYELRHAIKDRATHEGRVQRNFSEEARRRVVGFWGESITLDEEKSWKIKSSTMWRELAQVAAAMPAGTAESLLETAINERLASPRRGVSSSAKVQASDLRRVRELWVNRQVTGQAEGECLGSDDGSPIKARARHLLLGPRTQGPSPPSSNGGFSDLDESVLADFVAASPTSGAPRPVDLAVSVSGKKDGEDSEEQAGEDSEEQDGEEAEEAEDGSSEPEGMSTWKRPLSDKARYSCRRNDGRFQREARRYDDLAHEMMGAIRDFMNWTKRRRNMQHLNCNRNGVCKVFATGVVKRRRMLLAIQRNDEQYGTPSPPSSMGERRD